MRIIMFISKLKIMLLHHLIYNIPTKTAYINQPNLNYENLLLLINFK